MVPLRSAITLLGTPALISDCAPMMLRVRPAQLTTMVVSGEGTMSCTRSTSSAPGTLMPEGIETRVYSSNGRLSSTFRSAPERISASSSRGADRGRAAVVLDEFAERLARHVHAGKSDEAGLLPAGDAALEIRDVAIAGAREDLGRARDQSVIVVDEHDARVLARHQRGEAQLQAAQRHVARPQQMILREGQFLAHVDEREFVPVAEHGFDGGGGDGAELCFFGHGLSFVMPGLDPGIPLAGAVAFHEA